MFGKSLGQRGQNLQRIADDAVVGKVEDRRVGVGIDRNDHVRGLHADAVLDRARDAGRNVELGSHRLAGLANLTVSTHPASLHAGPRGTDFAAQHADISTGGIGAFGDWTLVIVRTDQGRALLSAMKDRGLIETRPGDDDPGAIALLHKLAMVSRKRWPDDANPGPRRIPVVAK